MAVMIAPDVRLSPGFYRRRALAQRGRLDAAPRSVNLLNDDT
jgi:hypothetical protein